VKNHHPGAPGAQESDGARGAVPEERDRASGAVADAPASRGEFVRRAIVAGGAAAAGGVLLAGLPRFASSAPSRREDARIFGFILELEYLKAAFYREAAERGEVGGEALRLARVLSEHERAHVDFFRRQLGDAAPAEPTFDFADATTNPDRFLDSALLLEENAVSAYVGQGANLTRERMVPFGRIASVEGRHTAWVRDILGQNAAPLAADAAKTAGEVRAAMRGTGFVTSG
jgi:rubrerythrin